MNADGGWGDTVTSPSNLSTTALCWAALAATDAGRARYRPAIERAEAWIRQRAGSLERDALSQAIQAIYGEDRTFSVPDPDHVCPCGAPGRRIGILARTSRRYPSNSRSSRAVGSSFSGLPVVSYALPALIAIGQTQHHHRASRLPPLRWLRERCRTPTLRLLEEIQPESGGFLEAIPLTSFVTMSLAECGVVDEPVIGRCVDFLVDSVSEDGSWPIDVNLATWVTTLSVNALGTDSFEEDERRVLVDWLLGQHHVRVHPFTQADPGGWAWTDLSGGVPDADDTSGALLALAHLAPEEPRVRAAAELGVGWLLGLVNRDGGIPTFCRGWGKLPFDRSSPDLTAHAMRAWNVWQGRLSASTAGRIERATRRASAYLERCQREDGSWVPLWFGNQAAPSNENPVYGTTRVLLALAATGPCKRARQCSARQCGTQWLLDAQGADGGWGGAPGVASSIEETALAVEALGALRRSHPSPEIDHAGGRGLAHLSERIDDGDLDRPSPIGLYFADLWYSEKLYPRIFAAAALGRWHRPRW